MSGFLERLRRDKELQERAKQERVSRAENAREELRQRLESERQLHNQRRRQVEQYHNESGIGNLLSELKKLVVTTYIGEALERQIRPRDGDSRIDTFAWNHSSKNKYAHYPLHSERGMQYYTNWADYFLIETTPDGTIYFDGGPFGASTIQRHQWISSKQVLQNALEKAYNHPKKFKWDSESWGYSV